MTYVETCTEFESMFQTYGNKQKMLKKVYIKHKTLTSLSYVYDSLELTIIK